MHFRRILYTLDRLRLTVYKANYFTTSTKNDYFASLIQTVQPWGSGSGTYTYPPLHWDSHPSACVRHTAIRLQQRLQREQVNILKVRSSCSWTMLSVSLCLVTAPVVCLVLFKQFECFSSVSSIKSVDIQQEQLHLDSNTASTLCGSSATPQDVYVSHETDRGDS